MKYIFISALEMVDFCKKNGKFTKQFGHEMTKSLPDIITKIMNNRPVSKEDEIYSTNMITTIDKKSGLINPIKYYKLLGNDKFIRAFGLDGMFVILLFKDNFEFLGSANLGFAIDGITVTIQDLFIVSKYRGRKYGKVLVNTIINKVKMYKNIKKILLEVDPTNRKAYNLYKKTHFVPIVAFNTDKVRMELWL